MDTPYITESPGNGRKDYLEPCQLTSDSEDVIDQWGNVWEAPENPWDEL